MNKSLLKKLECHWLFNEKGCYGIMKSKINIVRLRSRYYYYNLLQIRLEYTHFRD